MSKKSEVHECEYCRLMNKALPKYNLQGCNALAIRAVEKATETLMEMFDKNRKDLKKSLDDGLIDKMEFEKCEEIILSNAVFATSRFAVAMLVARGMPVKAEDLMKETISSFNEVDGLNVISIQTDTIKPGKAEEMN